MSRKKTHEEFLEDFKNRGRFDEIEIIGEYISNKTPIKCRCKKHGHEFEQISDKLISRRYGCPYCSGRRALKGFNTFGDKYPDLVQYFKNPEEAFEYTFMSDHKVDLQCPHCKSIRIKSLHHFARDGFRCNVCGNYLSYPNRLLRRILRDKSINSQVQNLQFEWVPFWNKKIRFDAYFEKNNKQYVIECQGNQHYNFLFKGIYDPDLKNRDEDKRIKAKENNITEIEIECKEPNFEYIKDKILKSELNELIDFSKVNWKVVQEDSYKNIYKKICYLYNENPLLSTSDISKELKINNNTVFRALKQGNELNWCEFADEIDSRRWIKSVKEVIIIYDNNKTEITKILGKINAYKFLKVTYPNIYFNEKRLSEYISKKKAYKDFYFEIVKKEEVDIEKLKEIAIFTVKIKKEYEKMKSNNTQ